MCELEAFKLKRSKHSLRKSTSFTRSKKPYHKSFQLHFFRCQWQRKKCNWNDLCVLTVSYRCFFFNDLLYVTKPFGLKPQYFNLKAKFIIKDTDLRDNSIELTHVSNSPGKERLNN